MSPITHPYADLFLLGFISAGSLAASLFFLRFWKETGDFLFLAFAVFFVVQGGTKAVIGSLTHPNAGHIWIYCFRLLSVLLVLFAILWKNAAKR
jgi:hypothetical protein